jgi:hypothetical protein
MPLCSIQTKRMKNLLSLSALAFSLFLASCGNSASTTHKKDLAAADVPAAVMAAFMASYPNATDVRWEKENHDGMFEYEATFKHEDGKGKTVEYDEVGTMVKGD